MLTLSCTLIGIILALGVGIFIGIDTARHQLAHWQRLAQERNDMIARREDEWEAYLAGVLKAAHDIAKQRSSQPRDEADWWKDEQ